MIWKSWKTQKICRCTPPEIKIFEISPKMRRFGGKRWEKLWIGWNWQFWVNPSLIFGGKDTKIIQNNQIWPFWINQSHVFAKFAIVGDFWATLVWNDLKKLENSKKLPMYTPHLNYIYLYTLDHNFVTIHPIWKKQRCKCAQHQGSSFSFFGLLKISKKFCPLLTYMVGKIFLDIHQKPILQKLNIKAVGDKLSNYLSDFNM